VDPKNEQERVCRIYTIASEDEKHASANMVVKLVQQKLCSKRKEGHCSSSFFSFLRT
jgi:hypothetical protein